MSQSTAWSPGEAEFCVLCTFWSEHRPLTERQLQARTGLEEGTLRDAVASLQASGQLTQVGGLTGSYVVNGRRVSSGLCSSW